MCAECGGRGRYHVTAGYYTADLTFHFYRPENETRYWQLVSIERFK